MKGIKSRKVQFSLATIFIAMTLFGLAMMFYRHLEHVEERVHFHWAKAGPTGVSPTDTDLELFQASREALLAGDEYRLEGLAQRFHMGQRMEIAYVPAQLIAVDNAIARLKDAKTRGDASREYHLAMAAEYEKSRWRPWYRIPDLPLPPETDFRAERMDVGKSTLNPQLIPIVEK